MFDLHAFNEDCECHFCVTMCEIVSGSPLLGEMSAEERAEIYAKLHQTWVPGAEQVREPSA